jgi:exodeoxyribonuclease VII large subunit
MTELDELLSEIAPAATAQAQGVPEIPVLSVSEFSNMIKGTVEQVFGRVRVRGEIIGLRHHSSGTYYFDLKESAGGRDYILNCVLWKFTRVEARLEEGLEVVITGRATTYSGRSSYQLTVEGVEISGIGALFKIIEERKKKLAAEGLFDPARKRPLPKFPRTIGVVTSPTGAVIRDIIHRISGRFPAHVIVWPCAVQGEGAAEQIAAAIAGFNSLALEGGLRPDVIIVARGGGSLQDLMPFIEEIVVRAAAASEIPLVSAVGHETDTTLVDYAADLRAPTPTAAAELCVPVRADLVVQVADMSSRVLGAAMRRLENLGLRLGGIWARAKSPMQFVADAIQRLDDKSSRLTLAIGTKIKSGTDRISYLGKILESYSFRNVLARGYGIVWNDCEVVSSAKALATLPSAEIEMSDGRTRIFSVAQPSPAPRPKRRPPAEKDDSQKELF